MVKIGNTIINSKFLANHPILRIYKGNTLIAEFRDSN